MKRLLLILLAYPVLSIAMENQPTHQESNSKELDAVIGSINKLEQKLTEATPSPTCTLSKDEADASRLSILNSTNMLKLMLVEFYGPPQQAKEERMSTAFKKIHLNLQEAAEASNSFDTLEKLGAAGQELCKAVNETEPTEDDWTFLQKEE